MQWKRTLNAGLVRTTRHRFVRAESPVAELAPAPSRPPARVRRRGLPRHYDEEARQTIRAVRANTMTSHHKLFALIVATRYVAETAVPGAVVECGVWRGGSMQAVARTLLALGVTDRDLHLFDTFDGMPEPAEVDRRHDGKPAADMLARRPDRSGRVWAIASLDDVRARMEETGYPAERIHFHRGLVQDTIPAQAPAQIAILRLDTDWYDSTRHELEHLYDRLEPGGVLLIDDYGYWQGARQAVDEFLEARNTRMLLLPMASGRVAVKP